VDFEKTKFVKANFFNSKHPSLRFGPDWFSGSRFDVYRSQTNKQEINIYKEDLNGKVLQSKNFRVLFFRYKIVYIYSKLEVTYSYFKQFYINKFYSAR